jgi:carboxylesterase
MSRLKLPHGKTGAPPLKRIWKLEALGYTKISIVGSSTGGTLLLELISSGYFNSHLHPTNLFLVDAIVVPSVKLQSVVGFRYHAGLFWR